MIKKRTILIILLIILFIGASLAIYFLTKENEELNITGTVLISGDGYIMIETENEDYIINGNQGKNTNLNETNGNTNTNNSPNKNHTSNNNTNKTPTNNNSNNNVTSKSADEAVLEYVNTIQSDADKGITDTLKSGFITVVDFLFYNGKIAGHTFNELTTSAKLEVLKAALWIDDKIDNVFPGYKETISNGANKVYTSIKNLIVNAYLDITSNICENHDDLCTSAKEGFQDLKESFGLTWEFLKDLASSGLDKLKNWYEIWSGK